MSDLARILKSNDHDATLVQKHGGKGGGGKGGGSSKPGARDNDPDYPGKGLKGAKLKTAIADHKEGMADLRENISTAKSTGNKRAEKGYREQLTNAMQDLKQMQVDLDG